MAKFPHPPPFWQLFQNTLDNLRVWQIFHTYSLCIEELEFSDKFSLVQLVEWQPFPMIIACKKHAKLINPWHASQFVKIFHCLLSHRAS